MYPTINTCSFWPVYIVHMCMYIPTGCSSYMYKEGQLNPQTGRIREHHSTTCTVLPEYDPENDISQTVRFSTWLYLPFSASLSASLSFLSLLLASDAGVSSALASLDSEALGILMYKYMYIVYGSYRTVLDTVHTATITKCAVYISIKLSQCVHVHVPIHIAAKPSAKYRNLACSQNPCGNSNYSTVFLWSKIHVRSTMYLTARLNRILHQKVHQLPLTCTLQKPKMHVAVTALSVTTVDTASEIMKALG